MRPLQGYVITLLAHGLRHLRLNDPHGASGTSPRTNRWSKTVFGLPRDTEA